MESQDLDKTTLETFDNALHAQDTDAYPPTIDNKERTHHCYTAIVEPTGNMHTDTTGQFITPSTTGNNYLFVIYDFDSNLVWAERMKNRKADNMVQAYCKIHMMLVKAGLRPRLQHLDNECSNALKEFLKEQKVDYQLAPPGIHQRNAVERAIQTFKNHFIAGLCSTDTAFPLHLRDKLLPQELITLNLMRASHVDPTKFAYETFHSPFDYNHTPLAPPGMKVVVRVG
jgi:hypothetical protein